MGWWRDWTSTQRGRRAPHDHSKGMQKIPNYRDDVQVQREVGSMKAEETAVKDGPALRGARD